MTSKPPEPSVASRGAPDAAKVIRQRLVALMEEMTLQQAIRRLLDEDVIDVGNRLWIDVDYGLGRARPQ